MKFVRMLVVLSWWASIAAMAAPRVEPQVPLSADGEKLAAEYAATLDALRADLGKSIPVLDERKTTALAQVRAAVKTAEAEAAAAKEQLDKVKAAEGLVGHAKGKWIGGADKGIAAAQAALAKATTDAERDAAKKELAHWQADREAGIKALAERQAAYDAARAELPKLISASQAAQSALGVARSNESKIVRFLLNELGPFLASDRLDARLVKCTVLTEATPRGLAAFAEQSPERRALVARLLADDARMKDMLEAGGARQGKYGEAFQIFTAIQQASPRAREGLFQRLALATSLEHAVPTSQKNAVADTNAPAFIDPVKRYLHYEKAYLDGELDPAFKTFTAWEYRMVVDVDAPDAILSWGREMLRTYRPDHIHTDYGWRYAMAVRTDVAYGSQNVKDDRPELNEFQNIPLNGGVCGRRAFFGRFLVRAFGIPVWGVSQYKHAALSHWTPKGWVVNLGAGFDASWVDKDRVTRAGADFLVEAQAREHAAEFIKVLRASWISRILGEPIVSDRHTSSGGFWYNLSRYEAAALAANAVTQGPLGEDLAEANEARERNFVPQAAAGSAEAQAVSVRDGSIVIPATLHAKSSGSKVAMKSFGGGMQMHCGGGFKARYTFDAPQAGRYAVSARIATLQGGQKLLFSANEAKPAAEILAPHTVGLWQQTPPALVTLAKGPNILDFEIQPGARGVTIQSFTLAPSR